MARDKAKHAQRKREWQQAHREYYRMLSAEQKQREREKCQSDPDYYAQTRGERRLYDLCYRRDNGGVKRKYAPRFRGRIPDWACKGEKIMNYGSQFLIDNQTAEQRAYARELYRERNPR